MDNKELKNLHTELSDDQLDQVAGGVLQPIHTDGYYEYVYCCQACGQEVVSTKSNLSQCSCGGTLQYIRRVYYQVRNGKE